MNYVRMSLRLTTALSALFMALPVLPGVAAGQTAQPASGDSPSSSDDLETIVVTSQKTTRSSVVISGQEAQKLLPGISPLKAIETLPGVVFETSDPWGNNEQNESLVIHGFTTQQLGYTMDGVPLGDQQYGGTTASASRAR